MSVYVCCDQRRRDAIRSSALNGVDYLEVVDSDAPSAAERQRILRVHFLKPPAPPGLTPANVVISGGDRIKGVRADGVSYDGNTVVVHLNAYGDYSPYRLQFVAATGSTFNLASLDPQLSFVDFSFKVECPSEFDCKAEFAPGSVVPTAPQIDYLARDYASFRQLMLDRLAVRAPQWRERNPADLGVALVELFAHVGDLLSYRQDAVATEAYLGTARRRVSVRRHARLVDYVMHEGANARAFIQVETSADLVLPKGTQTFTALPGTAARLAPASNELARARALGPEVFETMHEARLFRAHNQIIFYTFGDGRCRLPKGATRATLKGQLTNLAVGDILVFEETRGPGSGKPADADPVHRHTVRLSKVTVGADPLGGAFETPPTAAPTPVTDIEWTSDDATPFDLQISAQVTSGGVAQSFSDITVARGNIVLVDHGTTVPNETLGPVPEPSLALPPLGSDPCAPAETRLIPARFRPRLQGHPLVYAAPFDPQKPPASARATLLTSAQDALPSIGLTEVRTGQPPATWGVRRDLLDSEPEDQGFVVETESDGSAYLRFGDDRHGQRPPPGATFTAQYRIGGATRGNVAADAISHVVSGDTGIVRVRNVLPAQGGTEPESLEHVRRNAPFAFRSQRRAVTPDDYRAAAEQHPAVQRAAATFRWTGSWPTVFVTIDRFGGSDIDAPFEQQMLGFLEPFRLAGHDIEVNGPDFVPLEIEMRVVAQPDHFRADVKEALLGVFSAGFTPSGAKGVFHPDNFTFGQSVYLSPLYAAAQQVDGVASVDVTTFQRQGHPDLEPLRKGRLDIARLEIARLDNDPDFPERGVFRVTMEGGK